MDREAVHAEVARRIRERATARGLTLKQLAEDSGVSEVQLHEVLAGRASPTVEWLHKIATALAVRVRDLLPS